MSTMNAATPEILAGGVIEKTTVGEQVAIFKPEDLRSDHFSARFGCSARQRDWSRSATYLKL